MKRLRKGNVTKSKQTNDSDSDDDGGVFASSSNHQTKKNNSKIQQTINSIPKPNTTSSTQQSIVGAPTFTTRVISKNSHVEGEQRRFESESSSSEDSDMEDRRARLKARLLSKQKEEANLGSLDSMLLGGGSSTNTTTLKSELNSNRINKDYDDEDLDVKREKVTEVKQDQTNVVVNIVEKEITQSVLTSKSNTISQQSIPDSNQTSHSHHFLHHTDKSAEDSSDGSSSSEEEDIRPVFISKSKRSTIKTEQELEEEENRQLEMERNRQEQKREKSVQLLNKELENEANRKKAIKIDEQLSSVNDSDDIDPNGEMMAWIEREMKRLSIITQNRDESEREYQRRANNSSFKENEDKEKGQISQSNEKPKFKTGQRYYHKGAFFMDDEEIAEKAAKVAYAPTGKDLINYDLLPKYYQTKNPGRARQPKYTNLKDQDTTDFSSPFYTAEKRNREKKQK